MAELAWRLELGGGALAKDPKDLTDAAGRHEFEPEDEQADDVEVVDRKELEALREVVRCARREQNVLQIGGPLKDALRKLDEVTS